MRHWRQSTRKWTSSLNFDINYDVAEDIVAAAGATKDDGTIEEELEDEMSRRRMTRRWMLVPRRENLLARRRVSPRRGHDVKLE